MAGGRPEGPWRQTARNEVPVIHDIHQVIRGCSSKNRYDSEQAARAAAAKVYAERGVWLRQYACVEGCGGWHNTHVKAEPPPAAADLRPPRKGARQLAAERKRHLRRGRVRR